MKFKKNSVLQTRRFEFVTDGDGLVCGLLYGEHTALCGEQNDGEVKLVVSMADVAASVAADGISE